MTFLVLHDKLQSGALSLHTPVKVEAVDSRIGGTQVWLKENEEFPVEELLYAMMIQSANDAAYALARTAAGSVSCCSRGRSGLRSSSGWGGLRGRSCQGSKKTDMKIKGLEKG